MRRHPHPHLAAEPPHAACLSPWAPWERGGLLCCTCSSATLSPPTGRGRQQSDVSAGALWVRGRAVSPIHESPVLGGLTASDPSTAGRAARRRSSRPARP